ncbi:MAG: polysaccharide deacetylase [Acidobacteria bacterium]|nr:polysaccharide deacetylase [Acidobacteriota bacterium]
MLSPLPLIAGAICSAGAASIYYATYSVRSQWLGATVWRGSPDTSAVALTFDDGPGPDTERILDVLGEQHLCATFFMIGRHVERFPKTAARVVTEGHEVGNHSYSHPIFLYQSRRQTSYQLGRTQAVIAYETGTEPELARPPCGVRTRAYFRATRELGLRTVQWDVAGFDWRHRNADQIAQSVLSRVCAGSIILLHDGDSEGKQDRRATVAALPLIIGGLSARGLSVVPLRRLLGDTKFERAA